MKKYVDTDYLRQFVMPIKDHTGKIENVVLYKNVETAPAADVQEVVHGEWIRHIDGGQVTYECSECNEEFAIHNGTQISDIHYCPNCGAKMFGGEL